MSEIKYVFRVRVQDVEVSIEKITPQEAKEYLRNLAPNRPRRPHRVGEYNRSMEANAWMLNGESIKFDTEGRLVDGQHRLEACVMSDKPFWTVVVRGLTPAAVATLDRGLTRGLADVLSIRGNKNATHLAAAAGWFWRLAVTPPGNVPPHNERITVEEAFSALAEEDLVDSVQSILQLADKCGTGRRGLGPLGLYAALRCHFYRSWSERAPFVDDFFSQLLLGHDIELGNPILLLRSTIQSSSRRLRTYEIGAFVIKTFNAKREGKKLTFLRWRRGEAYPDWR